MVLFCFLQWIKSSWSDIRCVVLVNDDQGSQEMLDQGADLGIIKGMLGVKLVAKIEKLLYPESFDSSVSTDTEDEIHNKKGK